MTRAELISKNNNTNNNNNNNNNNKNNNININFKINNNNILKPEFNLLNFKAGSKSTSKLIGGSVTMISNNNN